MLVDLARKRAATFWNRKFVMVSTPTNRGSSRIEAAFENSDKREYHVECADCGEHQVMQWANVHWEADRPETAVYHCEHCGTLWDDAARQRAIKRGKWIATNPLVGVAVSGFLVYAVRGYHWKKRCAIFYRQNCQRLCASGSIHTSAKRGKIRAKN